MFDLCCLIVNGGQWTILNLKNWLYKICFETLHAIWSWHPNKETLLSGLASKEVYHNKEGGSDRTHQSNCLRSILSTPVFFRTSWIFIAVQSIEVSNFRYTTCIDGSVEPNIWYAYYFSCRIGALSYIELISHKLNTLLKRLTRKTGCLHLVHHVHVISIISFQNFKCLR